MLDGSCQGFCLCWLLHSEVLTKVAEQLPNEASGISYQKADSMLVAEAAHLQLLLQLQGSQHYHLEVQQQILGDVTLVDAHLNSSIELSQKFLRCLSPAPS